MSRRHTQASQACQAPKSRRGLLLLGLLGVGACVLVAGPVFAGGAEPGSGLVATLILFGVLLVALAVGEPLFVIIGLCAALCFYLWGEGYEHFEDYQIFVVKMANLTKKNVLLAIPFFMISGSIMTAGGIARRLVEFARALVGFLPGGLAIATVGGCVFFAAISGSSPVTVIAIGTMMYPALVKAGYRDRFSLGLVTSAGSLGILIPPSIPMLVFAIVASTAKTVDVGELFLAGVLPGALIGGLMGIYAMFKGKESGESSREPFSLREVGRRYREGFWALNLPLLILGGIYSGLFTPTEAAAISVVYALVVELFIHRELKLSQVPGILIESGVLMGSLLVIMAMSFGLNHFLADAQVPTRAVSWIREMQLSPLTFLLALNLLLIAVGFVMDSVSAILILAPLLVPIGVGLGLDPVHLGVVFIVNLEIGYLTPPIGLNLFVSQSVFGKPLGEVVRSVIPFIGLMLAGLVMVTYIPSVALGPVNVLLRGKPFYEPLPTPSGVEDRVGGLQPGLNQAVASPPKAGVRSLKELMDAARKGASAPEAAEPAVPPKVRSLAELMQEAKRQTENASAAEAAEAEKKADQTAESSGILPSKSKGNRGPQVEEDKHPGSASPKASAP